MCNNEIKIQKVVLQKAYDGLISFNQRNISHKKAYHIISFIRFDKKTADLILKELENNGLIKLSKKRKEVILF